jgi:site-specific DNA recombinase
MILPYGANRGRMEFLERTAGQFDIVVSEALDRISRDQEDIAGIYKRLHHSEVSIFTLAEGPVDELHIGLKGTMNALFLKDLASKIRRGQRGRIKSGFSAGGLSYGYQVVHELSEEGNLIRGKRCMKQEEAAVVLPNTLAESRPARLRPILMARGFPLPAGDSGTRRQSMGIAAAATASCRTSSTRVYSPITESVW